MIYTTIIYLLGFIITIGIIKWRESESTYISDESIDEYILISIFWFLVLPFWMIIGLYFATFKFFEWYLKPKQQENGKDK